MRRHAILFTVVALCAGHAVAAIAGPAPRPVCSIVRDAKGDATMFNPGDHLPPGSEPGVNDPALDILSADVATNASTLTAVVRVHKVGSSAAMSPYGVVHQVFFTVDQWVLRVSAELTATGSTFDLNFALDSPHYGGDTAAYTDVVRDVTKNELSGVVDTVRNEVRMHVPMSLLGRFGVPVRPDSLYSRIIARSSRLYGPVNGVKADETVRATYRGGTRSCVPIGR